MRKEAAWALVNACTSGTAEHMQYLVQARVRRGALSTLCLACLALPPPDPHARPRLAAQAGFIPPLCQLLSLQDVDLVVLAMSGLNAILQASPLAHALVPFTTLPPARCSSAARAS